MRTSQPVDDVAPAGSRAWLASRIDHTILHPDASTVAVRQTVTDAVGFGCASVCVQPVMVPVAHEVAAGHIAVCSVVAFPHGSTLSEVKAAEAAAAVAQGASEIDMVAELSSITDGDDAALTADVARVRAAVPNVVLKVILESALWSPAQLRLACAAAVAGGADFVKTSTGFHGAGGATVEAVETMLEAVGRSALVKASGGIRDLATARAMLDAGATRLGMSATAAVLDELG
ncbi:MAG: deoxyribose-phosphate aldolase [Microthrixaceae bacterium]